ncbi:unnamed protein product [Acanthoscelides obtectus]|uniref:Uncharacterized protein n=1 Tax=Acanthoscelides obtectus TaxID=200917 RepID=A0A9P0LTU1_ACAOB|nr:unnamed protein product [Acanthoscelides obtectus]CAK1657192.1 hypothetical protein AOBTE_LOCUS20192 [Acanthoscelides obtectus]
MSKYRHSSIYKADSEPKFCDQDIGTGGSNGKIVTVRNNFVPRQSEIVLRHTLIIRKIVSSQNMELGGQPSQI